jgi:8-oxo-dGTP pyrophosphatase MutT (NUDIX family)
MSSTIKPWPVVSSRTEIKTRIFNLRTDLARNPRSGLEGRFHVLESPDWVNVIAITPEQKIVLIRQYRFGTKSVSLEIPGGLISPGENPKETAVRELEEETGYRPGRIELIGKVRPNPAILDNTCYTVLIEEAEPTGEMDLEPGEDISVELKPLDEMADLIKRGEIDHALVLNAFFWYFLPHLRTV